MYLMTTIFSCFEMEAEKIEMQISMKTHFAHLCLLFSFVESKMHIYMKFELFQIHFPFHFMQSCFRVFKPLDDICKISTQNYHSKK